MHGGVAVVVGVFDCGVLQWVDGSSIQCVSPQHTLNYFMQLPDNHYIIYVSDVSAIEGFIGHIVRAFPHNQHRKSMSWDAIISISKQFYNFRVTFHAKKSVTFYDIKNLLHSNEHDILNSYGSYIEAARAVVALDITAITAGSAAMKKFKENRVQWYIEKFPQLNNDIKTVLRGGYIGGYMQANPGEYDSAIDFDVNSMYPWILRTQWLPYGEPEEYDGEYEHDKTMPLHADMLTFRADLKDGGLPFLSDAIMSAYTEKSTSTHGFVTRVLTDIDQELLYENYDVTLFEHVKGWKFRRSKGMFLSYVNEWYNMKRNATGAQRELAKIMLNSLVGKMASIQQGSSLLPKWDNGTIILEPYTRDKNNIADDYIPVPMWVNAYARQRLLHECRKNMDRLIYANTDGFMLSGMEIPPDMELDSRKLGAWKVENTFDKCVILGMNRYQGHDVNGSIKLVNSGAPRSTPIDWKDYHKGARVLDDYGEDMIL